MSDETIVIVDGQKFKLPCELMVKDSGARVWHRTMIVKYMTDNLNYKWAESDGCVWEEAKPLEVEPPTAPPVPEMTELQKLISKLPCDMLVRDCDGDDWHEEYIVAHNAHFTSYPWREDNDDDYWSYAKALPSKETVPWTEEDFKVGTVIRGAGSKGWSLMIVEVSSGIDRPFTIGGIGSKFSVDDFLNDFTQDDGSKFTKEV